MNRVKLESGKMISVESIWFIVFLFFAESREKQTQRIKVLIFMLKCNDVHASEKPKKNKAMGYVVCKMQRKAKHVMLHDWPMPMHHDTLRKIELFFFLRLLTHHHMPADFAS